MMDILKKNEIERIHDRMSNKQTNKIGYTHIDHEKMWIANYHYRSWPNNEMAKKVVYNATTSVTM